MMVPPSPPRANTDPNVVYQPIHWMPGGQARFVVCVLLILLIWWGWASLVREDADEDSD